MSKPTSKAPRSQAATKAAPRASSKKTTAKPVPEVKGKIGILLAQLQKPNGASISDMMEATGWQAHSVRGALAGTIKKKLGLKLTSTREGKERLYRIEA